MRFTRQNDVLGVQPVPGDAEAKPGIRALHDFDGVVHKCSPLCRRARNCFDHASEAAPQRPEQRRARALCRSPFRQHSTRQAAVLPLQLDKSGQYAVHAELFRIAAVNSGEQRLGQIIDGFAVIVILDELGHRPVVVWSRAGPPEIFERHAKLRRPAH